MPSNGPYCTDVSDDCNIQSAGYLGYRGHTVANRGPPRGGVQMCVGIFCGRLKLKLECLLGDGFGALEALQQWHTSTRTLCETLYI